MKPIREALEKFTYNGWTSINRYLTDNLEGYQQYCVDRRLGLFAVDPISEDVLPIIDYLRTNYCIADGTVAFRNKDGKEQYFFELMNGSNGKFGNCTSDIIQVKEILEYLNYGPGKGIVDWANLYLYSGDMADDVYSWIITFTHA